MNCVVYSLLVFVLVYYVLDNVLLFGWCIDFVGVCVLVMDKGFLILREIVKLIERDESI